jgi:hypothetical protein
LLTINECLSINKMKKCLSIPAPHPARTLHTPPSGSFFLVYVLIHIQNNPSMRPYLTHLISFFSSFLPSLWIQCPPLNNEEKKKTTIVLV